MTEHKFTDVEIVKALELCFTPKGTTETCAKCPYHKLGVLCKIERDKDALDLINRQNEKITIQQKIIDDRAKEIFRYDSFIRDLHKQIETVKAEAVKEFADRLKNYYRNLDKTAGALIEYHIDQTVREMLEGVLHPDF